jgi:hypothetical protein
MCRGNYDSINKSLGNHTAVVSGNIGWSAGIFMETAVVTGTTMRVGKYVATGENLIPASICWK